MKLPPCAGENPSSETPYPDAIGDACAEPPLLTVSHRGTRFDHEAPLELIREMHRGYRWLAPSDLAVSETNLRRILVLGSCLAQAWGFHKSNLSDVPVDFVMTNHLPKLGLPPMDIESYDFQIIQISMRSLMHDTLLWDLAHDDLPAHQVALDKTLTRLEIQLSHLMEWNARYNILTFVSNFLVPQQDMLGRLMPRYDLRNRSFFVEQVNVSLEARVSQYRNAYMLDVDKVASVQGRMYVQDDSVNVSTHNGTVGSIPRLANRVEPMASMHEHLDVRTQPNFAAAIWAEAVAMYRTVNQVDAVKLVITDLDDTLWNGIAGDMKEVGPHMVAGWPLGVAEALVYLKKRGVLLAIASKNDELLIRKAWAKIYKAGLSMEDFAVVKINWLPKTDNVRMILQEVNLLSRSAVFIDDNPVERAAMRAAFPDMRVIGKYPYYLRRILLWAPETQVASISSESGRRTEMIKAQRVREAERTTMSREGFLLTLSLRVRLFEAEDSDPRLARIFELLNKTNQFNTTGRRWTRKEFADRILSRLRLFAFEVEDKYSDYGLVGVLLVQESIIEQFVMSCRVVGLDIEVAVVGKVVSVLRQEGRGVVEACLEATDANLLCKGVYRSCGFEENGPRWIIRQATAVPTVASVTFV